MTSPIQPMAQEFVDTLTEGLADTFSLDCEAVAAVIVPIVRNSKALKKARAAVPKADRCHNRVWAGGEGAQCSYRKKTGSRFCKGCSCADGEYDSFEPQWIKELNDDGTVKKWRHCKKKTEGLKWGAFCNEAGDELPLPILVDGCLFTPWTTAAAKEKIRQHLEEGVLWHEGELWQSGGKVSSRKSKSGKPKKARALTAYRAFISSRLTAIHQKLKDEAGSTGVAKGAAMTACGAEWRSVKPPEQGAEESDSDFAERRGAWDSTAYDGFIALASEDKKRLDEEKLAAHKARHEVSIVVETEDEEAVTAAEVAEANRRASIAGHETRIKELQHVDETPTVAEESGDEESGDEESGDEESGDEGDDVEASDLVHYPEDHELASSFIINRHTGAVYAMDDGDVTSIPVAGKKVQKATIRKYIKAGLRADM